MGGQRKRYSYHSSNNIQHRTLGIVYKPAPYLDKVNSPLCLDESIAHITGRWEMMIYREILSRCSVYMSTLYSPTLHFLLLLPTREYTRESKNLFHAQVCPVPSWYSAHNKEPFLGSNPHVFWDNSCEAVPAQGYVLKTAVRYCLLPWRGCHVW